MAKKPQSPAPSPQPPKRKPRSKHTPVVNATATACPKCGSTEREPFFNVRERAIAGTTPMGRPFTHVVWRRTRCTACGQTRDDKTFELRTRRAA